VSRRPVAGWLACKPATLSRVESCARDSSDACCQWRAPNHSLKSAAAPMARSCRAGPVGAGSGGAGR
jgi:hypothetical protein